MRTLVRAAVLTVAVLSLLFVLPGDSISVLLPALSPFVTIGSILTTHDLTILCFIGLIVTVISLVWHRLFCMWMCPVGLCMDGASRLRRRLGRRSVGFPNLGFWIVVATWGGGCLGYPLFLWLDPLARFTGAFSPGGHGPRPGAIVAIAAFLAMLVLSVLWANAWCARVCPLGACQDLLFALGRFWRCRLGKRDGAAPPDAGVPVPRRILLGAAAGAAWAGTTGMLGRRRPSPLRPPGAVAESAFRGLCTRCGNCLRVCPTGVIEQDLGSSGRAGLLTPVLRFHKDYCREDCVRCTQVCPTGALRRVPLAKKADLRLGLPRVDMSQCLLGEDRECSLCRSRCPYGAIRYVFSESDYTLTPQIDPDRCNGCGACEAACPTKPKKAIVVVPI